MEHIPITIEIPRGNGQIERMYRILNPILTKVSVEDPTKGYKFVAPVQRIINSIISRSTTHIAHYHL